MPPIGIYTAITTIISAQNIITSFSIKEKGVITSINWVSRIKTEREFIISLSAGNLIIITTCRNCIGSISWCTTREVNYVIPASTINCCSCGGSKTNIIITSTSNNLKYPGISDREAIVSIGYLLATNIIWINGQFIMTTRNSEVAFPDSVITFSAD